MRQDSKLVVYNWATKLLPATRFCAWLRLVLLKWAGVKVGRNVEIGDNVVVRGVGSIAIGDGVKIYDDVYMLCKPSGTILIGNDVCLATRVYIECGGCMRIGEHSYVMQETLLTANCGSSLIVGSNCQIAHKVSLKTSTHNIDANNVCIAGEERFDDIVIEDGAWLCAGSIVTPGVKIGHHAVVAAGAVVTADVKPKVMVAGVPAVVKARY